MVVWPWSPKRQRELDERVESELRELDRDRARLRKAKADRRLAHQLVAHLPQRRRENGISEGLEQLYSRRRF